VGSFYAYLRDPDCVSALGLVHQRFSTNTFPSWRLAHPYRFMAHNGEINTVRGNVNWMEARRRTMESELLGADLDKMWPLIPHGQSDTACLDNALELLLTGGYSLAHAMMMLMPEAWAKDPLIADQVAINYRKADITPRQKAMLDFAVKVSQAAQEVGEADFDALKAEGFDQEDIWDIAGIAAFFGLSNRMANVTSMRPNAEFYTMARE